MQPFTIMQFQDRFSSSDACLEEIKQLRFTDWTCPSCGRIDRLSRVNGRPTYACICGKQVSPLAGTPFEKSSTDLRLWFYAMYLMTATRAGISAKQLERELGVTYKTAWRMFHQIRALMGDDDDLLTGTVEVDEAYIGGIRKGFKGRAAIGRKHAVMGMVERGGRVRLQIVPSDRGEVLLPIIQRNVSKSALIQTDGHKGYSPLGRMGYAHGSVNHMVEYKSREGVHTNTIEGFWSHLKTSFKGVYKHAGSAYIQAYVNEYAWRYSHRNSQLPLFDVLLLGIARPSK